MSLDQRRRILEHLHDPGTDAVVVANCRVLSEGVDVPELDGVAFCDPRDSATDVVQAVGRALRRGAEAGKQATILIPVLLNGDESPDDALAGGAWEMVWRTVRALSVHDERLTDELTEQRAHWSSRPHGVFQPRLPAWLEVSGADVLSEDLAAAIGLRIIESGGSSWWANYQRARAFFEEHGHLRVPTVGADGTHQQLSDWIFGQRTRRKDGNLTEQQITALDAIAMEWDRKKQLQPTEMVAALAEVHRERGHLDLARNYKDKHGRSIGNWPHRLRLRGPDSLSDDDRVVLESIGFCWEADQVRESIIAACEAWFAAHGDVEVPEDYVDPRTKVHLAAWIDDVRRGLVWPFGAETDRLERIGVPAIRKPRQWQRLVERLEAFKAAHGHLNVPSGHDEPDGYRLGRTLQKLRYQRRKGKLREYQVADLERLGIAWDPHQERFAQFLAACDRYIAEHGHLRVVGSYVDAEGYRLGERISHYRRLGNGTAPGTLSDERRAELDARGMLWRLDNDHPGDDAPRSDGPSVS